MKEVRKLTGRDFEMDLIVAPDQHAILTLVEKSTNMLLMQKLPFGKQSKSLAKVVRELLLPYKDILKTITTDNGPEFAAHKDITKFLGVPVYFADPYCSCQKGTIENTNKLIRQYIPKKDSFEHYTEKRIMSIQKKLNERPREKLNLSTSKCEFFKHVL
ncbi:integrase core domain protein [Prevotella amnii CRIS 21A-A]|uniref:Integrase core domain protein n=1 Tax=Prevotella amnii CRIS 21A-A TaxID=679191 RepID=E1GT10_9BACT|nr:integrase core domain protein [Prevotella amnii CRIS 21A-A]